MKPIPYPADTSAKGWRFELDYERINALRVLARIGVEHADTPSELGGL